MTGHNASCDCPNCLVADMNMHLATLGMSGERMAEIANAFPASANTSVRTRYATPGTRTGRGFVRKISDPQLRYMRRLFNERDTSGLTRLPGSESIETMSLAGARDLIDRLLGCPMKANAPVRMATEAQLNYIDGLISGRECPNGSREWFDAKRSEITFESASEMIGRLKALPFKTVKNAETGNAIPNGRYAIENADGELRFYHVRTSKAGRQYVCVMASDDEIYIKNGRSIIAEIAKDAEAAMLRYGREIGACGHCGRTLTDEASRAAGIGPICAGKAF